MGEGILLFINLKSFSPDFFYIRNSIYSVVFMMSKDKYFMSLAIEEAKKGIGNTSPNPMVGCIIVKNNKILSRGYHKKAGTDHAEIDAIKKLNEKELKNSTMYVTLEPCCHYGRTPPCVDTIIKSGIKKVVIAVKDIDERVSGKGIELLNNAKIITKVGVMEEEAIKLNSIYFYYKKYKKPYVVLKVALTLDGKIATNEGDSKWISNEESRYLVHKLRLRLKSIAVGKNTILKDKPLLNCRLPNYEDKIIDKLVFTNSNDRALFESFAKNEGRNFFIDKKITETRDSFINFCIENQIDSILVEGGAHVYTWFLENDLVDRVFVFYKPAFLGSDGIDVCLSKGKSLISELQEFSILNIKKLENNIMVDMIKGEEICLQVS